MLGKYSSVEAAQNRRPSKTLLKPLGVPLNSIDATKPTGINSNVLYPCKDKINAAYHAGDVFTHGGAPFT